MQGQASDIAIVADELDRMTNWLCETLSFHTDGKKTAEQIAADIQRDKTRPPRPLRSTGLVDEVLVSRKIQPQA